ncbi:LysR family transcriptional regulator [Amorphus sp. 3PC139-8]|uniref:LysR family transcriptional regulator n=1 Tax=Amorphus sp. 3PC139-8 TaxID=2735676 RepID=UPI00345CE0FB
MNKDPNWDLYRTFGAVLEEGSLSGAARALGLTQPSVARHIDALEAAIGADLFIRTQRGLTPTDLALELKPYVDLLGSTAAALRRTADGSPGEVSGTVRISTSEVVGIEHMAAILTKMRRRYPELALEMTLSNDVDDLAQREADIAIRMVRPTQQALIARRVGVIPLGLHAHRSYLDRRGMPESLADLKAYDLIGFDVETPAIRRIAAEFPQLSRSVFAFRSDSDVAQLAAIRAGFGIGVCQRPVAARDPNLVAVLPDAFRVDLDVWVVMHEDLRTSMRCRAVFDALVEGLRPLVTKS